MRVPWLVLTLFSSPHHLTPLPSSPFALSLLFPLLPVARHPLPTRRRHPVGRHPYRFPRAAPRCSALSVASPFVVRSFHAQRFVSRTWGTRISTSISQITRHRRCGRRTTSFGNFTRRWVEEEELLNVTSASLALHCLDSLLSL